MIFSVVIHGQCCTWVILMQLIWPTFTDCDGGRGWGQSRFMKFAPLWKRKKPGWRKLYLHQGNFLTLLTNLYRDVTMWMTQWWSVKRRNGLFAWMIFINLYKKEPMVEIQRECSDRMKQNHFDFLVITSSGSWRSHCEILKNIILELELLLIWGYNVFYILKNWQIKRKFKEALDESIKLRNTAMQLKNNLSRPLKYLLRVAVMK